MRKQPPKPVPHLYVHHTKGKKAHRLEFPFHISDRT